MSSAPSPNHRDQPTSSCAFRRPVVRRPARRRVIGWGGAFVLAAVLVVPLARAGAEAPPADPKAAYDAAAAAVGAAQARVDELFAQRRTLEAEGGQLTAEQQHVTDQLEDARREAQKFVVAAYVSGSGPAVEEALVYNESTTDVAYKSFFVKDHVRRIHEAVERQRAAFTEVDSRLAEFAVRRGDNAAALDQANVDLDRARQRLREADARLRESIAQQSAAQRASAPPTTSRSSSTGSRSSGGGSGNASSSGWAQLRNCESGGRYNAVDPSGTYRGAYQFDVKTWRGLGGSGDPASASPAEQDYRAQLLYNQRGAQPWPICGKYVANDPNARHDAVPP